MECVRGKAEVIAPLTSMEGGPAQPFAFAAPVGEALLSQFIAFAQAAVVRAVVVLAPGRKLLWK